MKIPLPRNQGYSGGAGGVGRRPTPRVWMPGSKRSDDGPPERVPRRFRLLKLKRRTRSRVAPTSASGLIVLVLMGALIFYLLIQMITS